MSTPTIGFVGLGQMGSLLAGHLVDWPGGLVVFDVRRDATAPFAERGAVVATAVGDLAARADIVCVMVIDDDQVREVVDDLCATARAGLVIAVHSTIGPRTAEELATRAARDGVVLVDAPVSGGVAGASAGRLAVMVGGDASAYQRCREPFSRWSDLIVHAGPVGAGTRMKLARNLIGFVAYCAAAEAQRLAESAGIDLRTLGEVVRHTDAVTGGPGSIMIRDTTEVLATDDPLRAVFAHTRLLGEKDLGLALELGAQLGVELPFASLALERFATGLGLGPEEA